MSIALFPIFRDNNERLRNLVVLDNEPVIRLASQKLFALCSSEHANNAVPNFRPAKTVCNDVIVFRNFCSLFDDFPNGGKTIILIDNVRHAGFVLFAEAVLFESFNHDCMMR